MIWKILDIELIDTLTNRKFIKRMETKGSEITALDLFGNSIYCEGIVFFSGKRVVFSL